MKRLVILLITLTLILGIGVAIVNSDVHDTSKHSGSSKHSSDMIVTSTTKLTPAPNGMVFGQVKVGDRMVYEFYSNAGVTAEVHKVIKDGSSSIAVQLKPSASMDTAATMAVYKATGRKMDDVVSEFSLQLQARGEPAVKGLHFKQPTVSIPRASQVSDQVTGKTYSTQPVQTIGGTLYWAGCGRVPGPAYPVSYHGSISFWQACSGRYSVPENDPGAYYRGDEGQGNGNGTYLIAFNDAYNLVIGGIENEYSGYGQIMKWSPDQDITLSGGCRQYSVGVSYLIAVGQTFTLCPDKIDVSNGVGFMRARWLGHSSSSGQTRAVSIVSITRFACYCYDSFSFNIFADWKGFTEIGGVMVHP